MTRPRSQRHLLVQGGTVLTQDAERRILDADVLITDGKIAAVKRDIEPPSPTRLLDAHGMIVLPGFVQAQTRLGHVLFRGLDRSPADIAALDVAHDDETAYWSGLLGAVECLLSGITTVAGFELARGMDGMRRAIAESGIRAVEGQDKSEGGGLDTFDLFERMRLIATIDRTVSAAQVLDATTCAGAGALGFGSRVGSLEPGKAGDLVVLDLRGHRGYAHPETAWTERIVRHASRGSVRWVVVDGEVLVEDGRMPHLDFDALTRNCDEAARRLSERGAGKGKRA